MYRRFAGCLACPAINTTMYIRLAIAVGSAVGVIVLTLIVTVSCVRRFDGSMQSGISRSVRDQVHRRCAVAVLCWQSPFFPHAP